MYNKMIPDLTTMVAAVQQIFAFTQSDELKHLVGNKFNPDDLKSILDKFSPIVFNGGKTAVIIGRFQLFHKGHEDLFRQVLLSGRYNNIHIILGSSEMYPNCKNPFKGSERKVIISRILNLMMKELNVQHINSVTFDYMHDTSDSEWYKIMRGKLSNLNSPVVVYGHKEGDKTQYWPINLCNIPNSDNAFESHKVDVRFALDSSALRNSYYETGIQEFILDHPNLSKYFVSVLNNLSHNPISVVLRNKKNYVERFQNLAQEYHYIKKCWEEFNLRQFQNVVMACDSFVYAKDTDSFLLIIRGKSIGKDSFALPGGFQDLGEEPLAGSLRELKEECKYDLDEKYYIGSFHVNYPGRCLRPQVATNVAVFIVDFQFPVEGGDDAAKAIWIKRSELEELKERCFTDHFQLIKKSLEFIDNVES